MPIKTQTVRITLNPRAGTPENCIFVGKAIVKNEQGIDIEMAMENTNRMFKDWGKNHDEDAKKKELADEKNTAEMVIFSAEKSLKEYGDKVDEATKKDVESKIQEVKDALNGCVGIGKSQGFQQDDFLAFHFLCFCIVLMVKALSV